MNPEDAHDPNAEARPPATPEAEARDTDRRPLSAHDVDSLTRLFQDLGEPAFRAQQVIEAVQVQGRLDVDEITTLGKALRKRLAERVRPPALELVERQDSEDGTVKYLFALADGRRIESVLIPEKGRTTLCVSSQVGCPIRCAFCASGVRGLIRSLDAAEIIEQVLHVRRDLGQRPSHIVMMGMGEPLLNFGPVVQALEIWTNPDLLGFSPRRITVSAAGTPASLMRLADTGLAVHVAVSLHGADDETRRRLVPGSPAGRVQGLIDAAAAYAARTRRDATVEYVLIRGENDDLAQAEALADAIRGRHIHVNLIPLNPVKHRPELAPPSGRAAIAFLEHLRERGVSATLRTQRGEDIDAACGQLALERALAQGEAAPESGG